jgi:hypothetical protein
MKSEPEKERACLVREIVANRRIRKPEGDQLKYRISLCKRIFSELTQFEPGQWLRMYEALCEIDFPEPEVIALRDQISRLLGKWHGLAKTRGVVIPGTEPKVNRGDAETRRS